MNWEEDISFVFPFFLFFFFLFFFFPQNKTVDIRRRHLQENNPAFTITKKETLVQEQKEGAIDTDSKHFHLGQSHHFFPLPFKPCVLQSQVCVTIYRFLSQFKHTGISLVVFESFKIYCGCHLKSVFSGTERSSQ